MDSTPRAYRLKASNACLSFSTFSGATPFQDNVPLAEAPTKAAASSEDPGYGGGGGGHGGSGSSGSRGSDDGRASYAPSTGGGSGLTVVKTPSVSRPALPPAHMTEAPPPRSRPISPEDTSIPSSMREAAVPKPRPRSGFFPKVSSSAPYRPKAFSSPSEGPFVEVSSASPKESVSPEDALSASKRQDRPWIDTRFASLMFWLMVPLSLIGIMVAVISFYKFIKPTLLKNRLSRNVANVGAFQPAANSSRPQLFISYSRKDLLQVKPVIEEIERLGVSPWIDWQNIRGGMGWAGELVKAIRDCNGTVVMCSSAAFRSDDVLRELYIASHFGKPIGPIFLEDATPPDEFLFFLLRPQQMRLFEVSANQRRQKLENYLASVIAGNTCSLPHPIMVSPA